MILCPARIEPVFRARPWGSLSLAPYFPQQTNLADPIGEAWMSGTDCLFANGPFKGDVLGTAWKKMPPEWTGTLTRSDAPFPLLVKFIFTEQNLSVQVHPGDGYAAIHEKSAGGRGKTEMWYAMRATAGAEVMVGLKPGTTAENFKRAIVDGGAENCLERIPLQAGDAVFVPAGTVHTIGAGLVLCEIQEYSDITYRVYDYNRRDAQGKSRELHIEKALDVIRFGKQTGGRVDPVRIGKNGVTESYFVACPYFVTEKWEFSEPAATSSSREHFDLFVFLDGRGKFRWGNESLQFAPMQAWMIPAALGSFEIIPDSRTALLRTYVPNDIGEFTRRLAGRGIPEAAMLRLLHP